MKLRLAIASALLLTRHLNRTPFAQRIFAPFSAKFLAGIPANTRQKFDGKWHRKAKAQKAFYLGVGLISAATLIPFHPAALATDATPAPAVVNPQEKIAEATKDQPLSVVRVNCTTQAPDFLRPWSKHAPLQRRAVGAVLPGNRVLVTAELVANATYVELENADTGDKTPATVATVDYECDLALLVPSTENFLSSLKPLAIVEPSVGDDLAIWQLEANGTLLSTRALLTTAEVAQYPIADTALLLYRATSTLQPRDGSFSTPVVKDHALAGMLLRYNTHTQSADVIPAPVIEHFLKAASDKAGYAGFPRVGLTSSPLRDPQLRHYAGLSTGTGGIYVTAVTRGGAAEQAGLKVGDVIAAVGDNEVDRDGNYRDPHYGKVSVVNLLTTRHFQGETVPFQIFRDGKEKTLNVTLTHPPASKSLIEPYTIDKAPRYYVLGGLVFMELSRQFLKEWGPEWQKKAPERFVYYDRFQNDLFKDDPRQRIVILTQVLPSPCTVGYEDLSGLVVTKINGVPLKSLADIEAAAAKPLDGFHRIEFETHPREIVLDASQVSQIEPLLMKNYGLPAIKSPE